MERQKASNLITEFETNLYDWAHIEEMKHLIPSKYVYYCVYKKCIANKTAKEDIINLFEILVLEEDK